MTTGEGPLPCCAVKWCLKLKTVVWVRSAHACKGNQMMPGMSRAGEYDDLWKSGSDLEALVGCGFSSKAFARVRSPAVLDLRRDGFWNKRLGFPHNRKHRSLPPLKWAYTVIQVAVWYLDSKCLLSRRSPLTAPRKGERKWGVEMESDIFRGSSRTQERSMGVIVRKYVAFNGADICRDCDHCKHSQNPVVALFAIVWTRSLWISSQSR